MNTSALKSFAPAVRRQLMEAVTRKLDSALTAQTPDYVTTYARQVENLRELAETDRSALIERVAYTWFNRFTALRYLDAKGWHPFRSRILTPAAIDETQPEILKLARSSSLPEELQRHTTPSRLADILDGRIASSDPQGEVYRHLVLAACRFYNSLLPDLFERLDDETELLLPDDLLTEHSVVHGFRTEISDEDCAEVEILGWLYQFYISERKDEVMGRKTAVPTEDIPPVTQLFTPHWIVRYLVENSLGRLWLLNRPGSKLRDHMPYYIEGESETDFLKIGKPEEIRVCDPAVGSGHMLTYAFDLLTHIYEEEGHAPSEIPGLILQHNLYGLEICPRAAQLAELALVLKAREKSRRFFQPEHLVRPHIIELRDVRFAENDLRDYIRALGLGDDLFSQPVLQLLHLFEEAKNFGSLIQPCLDEQAIAEVHRAIEAKDLGGHLFLRDTHLKVLRVLEQAEALSQRYHVVVTNPPYMGSGFMNSKIKRFGATHFPRSKSDLFAMFIERGFRLAKRLGFNSLVTMESWMFLSSFEDLRETLLDTKTLIGLVHMPYEGRGKTSMGIFFGTAASVFMNRLAGESLSHFSYIQHTDIDDLGVPFTFPVRNERLTVLKSRELKDIPGRPIAYWASGAVRRTFTGIALGEEAISGGRCKTCADELYLRYHWEVNSADFGNGNAWIPLFKGGEFRKFYGNRNFAINWTPGARAHYQDVGGLTKEEFWGRSGITWTIVTSHATGSFRLKTADAQYNSVSPTIFLKADSSQSLDFLLALLNSKPITRIATILNSTLALNVGDVLNLPLPHVPKAQSESIEAHGHELVRTHRADWDNFETSWDFRNQPLLRPGLKGATLEASWRNWEAQSTAAIRRMQELETENNRLFIAAYGLDGELQPEVPEAQITLARAEARRDMAAFLSYAVGCMMGRYSLDHPGLILANTGETIREYLAKVGRPWDQLTFAPDEDGIIPMLDGEWFEDDIVARTRDFLRATFGGATLKDNLRFIEDSLGKDLRKYFLTDFYKDHLQTYKKRPIYWMVQSPKKGFSALVYLHRYTRDAMNLVLNRYLRAYQEKLRSRIAQLATVQASDGASAKDKTAAHKESDALSKTLRECEDWERQTILPLAQQRIELDLDDGVKVNYQKLGEALAKIPGLAAAED